MTGGSGYGKHIGVKVYAMKEGQVKTLVTTPCRLSRTGRVTIVFRARDPSVCHFNTRLHPREAILQVPEKNFLSKPVFWMLTYQSRRRECYFRIDTCPLGIGLGALG